MCKWFFHCSLSQTNFTEVKKLSLAFTVEVRRFLAMQSSLVTFFFDTKRQKGVFICCWNFTCCRHLWCRHLAWELPVWVWLEKVLCVCLTSLTAVSHGMPMLFYKIINTRSFFVWPRQAASKCIFFFFWKNAQPYTLTTKGENNVCHNVQQRAEMLTKSVCLSVSLFLALCNDSGKHHFLYTVSCLLF